MTSSLVPKREGAKCLQAYSSGAQLASGHDIEQTVLFLFPKAEMKGPSDGLQNALSSRPGFLESAPGPERGLVPLQPKPVLLSEEQS